MAIGCDHPRPALNLPGYTPPRFAWQPPAVIPTDPSAMARLLAEQFRGIYAVLQQLGQRRTVVPLIEDIEAREGQVIVGVGAGQTIRLPDGADGTLGQVGIVLTDVTSPVTVVNPDGTTQTLGQAGAYDFTSGLPEVYQTSPGGSVLGGGVPTDRLIGRDSPGTGAAEFIQAGTGLEFSGAGSVRIAAAAAGAGLVGGSGSALAVGAGSFITVNVDDVAVNLTTLVPAIDSASVVANGTVLERAALTGDVTAAQNSNATTISNDVVSDTKLRDSAGFSVIGRANLTPGDPGDIVATANGQVLKRLLSGGGLAWENPVRVQDGLVSLSGVYYHTINIADGTNTSGVGVDLGGGVASLRVDVDNYPLSGLADQAARTVVANATNANAAPTAVQGSTARHVFRVNAGVDALEWGFPTAWQANGGSLTEAFQLNILDGSFTTAAIGSSVAGVVEIQWSLDLASLLAAIDSSSIVVNGSVLHRAALSGAISANQNGNTTLFAGIRDNGSPENDRTNLNFVSGTNTTATVTDDAGNDELEIRFNVDDFPLTGLADQAAETFVGNFTGGSAAPTARAGSSVAGGGLTYTAGGTLAVGAGTYVTVGANDVAVDRAALSADLDSASVVDSSGVLQRAALTGFITASQNSNATASAEPLVMYSASSNASAERVTTSSTSIAISTGVAGQIEWQRAALTGEVTASANSNALTIDRATDFDWTGDHYFEGAFGPLVTEQTVAGSGPHDVTLNADTTRLTFSGSNVVVNSITGGADIGRVVKVYFSGSGVHRMNHQGLGVGNSANVFNPDNVNMFCSERGSFLLQANGSAGWRSFAPSGSGQFYSPVSFQRLFTSTVAGQLNNLNIGNVNVVKLTPTAPREITGMVAGAPGQVVILINGSTTTGFTLKMTDESDATTGTASTAANRFALSSSTSMSIPGEGMAIFWYDSAASRWRGMQ